MAEIDIYRKFAIYQRILFCTDFSDNANFAFDFALAPASRCEGSTLFLLHVIPEPDAQFWKTYLYDVENIDEKAKQDIDEKIASCCLPRVPDNVNLEVVVRIGRDFSEILAFAEENDVDLIVLGRQGQSGVKKVFFGNVTEKVVRRARCPVLVVPMCFEETVTARLAARDAAEAAAEAGATE